MKMNMKVKKMIRRGSARTRTDDEVVLTLNNLRVRPRDFSMRNSASRTASEEDTSLGDCESGFGIVHLYWGM